MLAQRIINNALLRIVCWPVNVGRRLLIVNGGRVFGFVASKYRSKDARNPRISHLSTSEYLD